MAAAKGHNAQDVEAAEAYYKLAEERFLAGNVAGALRTARKAQRLSSALPALAAALAAYEVHYAAASSSSSPCGKGKDWYAVLGLGGRPAAAVTHDAVKAQYRRLCLALHPDKNPSAAADGAFKLLRQAWEELSVIHPPAPASSSAAAEPRAAPKPTAQPRPTHTAPPPQAPASPPKASTAAADDDDVPPPPSHKPKPQPDPKSWKQAECTRTAIYCWHCDSEFIVDGVVHAKSGVRCHKCGVRLRPPWRSRPAPQQPPPKDRYFPCPEQCSRCRTRFSSLVFAGTWRLTCKACSHCAIVRVRDPNIATA
ncbi:hypothetical protein ACP70R_025795 [Stipagrostis hirtigluma subsp. patula]